MSKRKAKMSRLDINHKFKDYEQALKYAKYLKNAIDNICQANHYKCEAIIGISNIMGKAVTDYYYEDNDKSKIKRDVLTDDMEIINKVGKLGENGELGNVYVGYHLHVLMVSYPGETVRREIKSYINRTWNKIQKFYTEDIDPNYIKEVLRRKKLIEDGVIEEADEQTENNEEEKPPKKVYGKDCDTNYADYIFKQSESVIFVDVDYSDYKEVYGINEDILDFDKILLDSRYPCNLESLYKERLRLNTLYHYNNLSEEEKEKEEWYYNRILEYYKPFHKNYTDKCLREFINSRIQARKSS